MFADVFAGAEAGLGTRVAAVLQDFNTGTLETTNRNLDLAISGTGFFRFNQNGQIIYSRNGQLTLSNEGFMVNAQGARLTGIPANQGNGGNPVDLRIPSGALPAQASTAINATFNLDARMPQLNLADFDRSDSATYSYANNVTVFDSLGNAHNVTMYFIKTDNNEWSVKLSREGEEATATGVVNFTASGAFDSAAGFGSFTFNPGGGVAPIELSVNLEGSTQFSNDFELSSLTQDGYASGSLMGLSIDKNGDIIGNYSNEQTQVLGRIVLATFTNPEGLQSIGENGWLESSESGEPLLGMAGIGMFGSIESGVVENSNVDLTQELVNLIVAQRNYQANAQIIKVQDEVLQNAVNLR